MPQQMLKRLWQYCHKIVQLPRALLQLKNREFSDKNNEPLLTTILLIGMFMRLRSLHAFKLSFKNNSKFWTKLLDGQEPPSISTLGRGLAKSDVEGLANIVRESNHKFHRNKLFNSLDKSQGLYTSHGLMVAAVDGHETFSSEKRCCPACLTREKIVDNKPVTEYYHRYSVCQLILCSVPVIIDIEPLQPGEGELTASKRLIKRILTLQPRRVDVFVFDALYSDASLLNTLEQSNKFWVTVLKQENRDAYKDIQNLISKHSPIITHMNKREIELWDFHERVSWNNLDKPFRAVASVEKKLKWVRVSKETKKKVEETTKWIWLTNMPSIYKPTVIWKFGHARWDIENRGFRELATNCAFDHPFYHHPNALLAMMWIIALAFNLSYVFFERNLKPELRARIRTRMQLAEQIRSSIREIEEPLICRRGP